MQYYKVKLTADNVRKNVNGTDILIKNELYTEKELLKFAPKINNVNSLYVQKYFDIVNISKNDTYFFFGARFSKQFPYSHN